MQETRWLEARSQGGRLRKLGLAWGRLPLALLLAGCAVAPPEPSAPPQPRVDTAGRAEQWAALDGEALFTIAGGLKPMSGGFWQTWIDVAAPDLREVRRVRRELGEWRDDELWADVHVFDQVHEGRRAALAYVVDRAALAEILVEHRGFFEPYGLCPDTHPAEVVAVIERMPKLDRHRGQGLLFGYPQHAIDFFVHAERERDAGREPPKRRFVQIPTFGAAEGRFVYAVPEAHVSTEADRRLAASAGRVLARYRELRGGTGAGAGPGDGAGVGERAEAREPGSADVASIVRALRREFAGASHGARAVGAGSARGGM